MRIPIKSVKLIRWKDGGIVLELQPAFDSVDPIVVEMPEAVLSGLVSGMNGLLTQGPGNHPPFHVHPAPDVHHAANDAPAQAAWSGDAELTEEEIAWLARSAG